MARRRDVGQIWFTGKVVTRSAAHDIAGLRTKNQPQINADMCNPRYLWQTDLECEPQLRTNRATIINSFLSETEVVAPEIVVVIHVRNHRLT